MAGEGDQPASNDGWPAAALKLVGEIGFYRALATVSFLMAVWKSPELIKALSDAFGAWAERRLKRGNVEHERKLASDRLAAEIRLGELRLHMDDGRTPNGAQGDRHAG